jgi:hypothetical protein
VGQQGICSHSIWQWISFKFSIEECIHYQSVPGENEHTSSKNCVPSGERQNKKSDFLKNGYNHFHKLSMI